jgi:hypothetical protein
MIVAMGANEIRATEEKDDGFAGPLSKARSISSQIYCRFGLLDTT